MLDIVTLLYKSNKSVVYNRVVRYNNSMTNNKDTLTKYELKLYEQLEDIMIAEDIYFSAFLPVLVDEVPPKSNPDYYKVLKKEQMKLRRASFTVEEVHYMLAHIGWEFVVMNKLKPIDITKLDVGERVRFTDLMKVCDMFGFRIDFNKKPDRGGKKP